MMTHPCSGGRLCRLSDLTPEDQESYRARPEKIWGSAQHAKQQPKQRVRQLFDALLGLLITVVVLTATAYLVRHFGAERLVRTSYDCSYESGLPDVNSVTLGWMRRECAARGVDPAAARVWLPPAAYGEPTSFTNHSLGECLVLHDEELVAELGVGGREPVARMGARGAIEGGGFVADLAALQRALERRAPGWDASSHVIGVGHDWGCDERRVRFEDLVDGSVAAEDDALGTGSVPLCYLDVTRLLPSQRERLDALRAIRLGRWRPATRSP